MKKMLILSGKGGTGKTTVASAFIKISNSKTFADCDVDAPNLHLVLKELDISNKKDYMGMPKAIINSEMCIKCGRCEEKCRFDAISFDENKKEYNIDYFACESCGVCELICPVNAITLKDYVAGDIILYKNKEKSFSTAKLKMGNGTSGMLVYEVKKQMDQEAYDTDIAIIDGSPGIGCPVIASISGVDFVLVVTEPSIAGISDMERIVKTAQSFGVKIAICINKYDTNLDKTEEIIEYSKKNNISMVGKIPYDKEVINAVNKGITIVDIDCEAKKSVEEIYSNTISLF